MMSAGSSRPDAELDARRGEPLDGVGDHLGFPVADGAEQVAVGHYAQPLIPRIVSRTEVLFEVITLGQLALDQPHQDLPQALRPPPTGWYSATCRTTFFHRIIV
jgi:hypothetical protein